MLKWINKRLASFANAFYGIGYNFRYEINFRIQVIVGTFIIVLGVLFPIKKWEWVLIILFSGLVLAAEAMNTSIEKICDRFLEFNDPAVRRIKDSAAAAVLIIAITAFAAGLIIFLPYILDLIN